jgi:ribonuclease VapC
MIVDTSALVAIFLREPGHEALVDALDATSDVGIGTPTLVESGIVLTGRLRLDARALLSAFVQNFEIQPIPFGEDHWREALDAYVRFGKGRHAAALNLGDCFSYAVASLAEQPLLCVGDDFSRTGLPVLPAR